MRAFKYILSILAGFLFPVMSYGQDGGDFYTTYQLEIVIGVAVVVCVLALVALITVLVALRAVLKASKPETESSLIEAKPGEEGVGFWRRLWNRLNDSVPVAQEDTIMTGHEYDGIRELDNRLPPWWLYGFYVTIIFSVVYLLHFHVFKTGDLQEGEYQAEMQKAEAEVEAYLATLDNLIDEKSVTLTTEESDLAAGETIYKNNCAACHGQLGEGGVGPNFTDEYWIHGGSIKDIFKTVKYGVPSKGMIAWQAQLSPKEMQQVSSYIYTLEGTNPPNQKEPQGDLYEREASDDAGESESATVEAGI